MERRAGFSHAQLLSLLLRPRYHAAFQRKRRRPTVKAPRQGLQPAGSPFEIPTWSLGVAAPFPYCSFSAPLLPFIPATPASGAAQLRLQHTLITPCRFSALRFGAHERP